MSSTRRQRTYDHRLVRLVQETGDATIATGIGVPRSTVAGWLRRAPLDVTTAPGLGASSSELRVRVYDPDRGVLRRAWLFVMTLGYSRHMFGDLVFDQKVGTWIQLHVDAFAFFGGVYRPRPFPSLKRANPDAKPAHPSRLRAARSLTSEVRRGGRR